MYINRAFELSMVLDSDVFDEIFSRCYVADSYSEEDDSEYVDHSISNKGITVYYRASQYKKKLRLIVDVATVTGGALSDTDKLISKLSKQIERYFQSEFLLDDFTLSGLTLSTAIDVKSRENVAAYLKVIRRIGRVKGFESATFDEIDEKRSFCLRGKSNGVDFLLYDLEHVVADKLMHSGEKREVSKSKASKYKGILRTEVRLTKPKAIRKYTCAYSVTDQITELSEQYKNILMENFARVIPYGDFRKKDEATEVIRREVRNEVVKRRMLRLLALIPEKKSLHLAQRAMSYRHPDELLVEFARINLSPINISVRQDTKYLKNLYEYFD